MTLGNTSVGVIGSPAKGEQGGPSRPGKFFFVLSAIMAALGIIGLIAGEEQAVVLFLWIEDIRQVMFG